MNTSILEQSFVRQREGTKIYSIEIFHLLAEGNFWPTEETKVYQGIAHRN